jgi:hypothetical protein
LRIVATDNEWTHGAGPEVCGPALSLLLAVCGRPAEGSSGDGVATLCSRMT